MSIVRRLKFKIYKRIFPYTNIFFWRRTKVYMPRKCHLVWRFLQTGEYESANIASTPVSFRKGQFNF